MNDAIFEKILADVDPDVGALINGEERRQAQKIIMIASESLCPKGVREALSSVFTNLYAEGYPSARMSGSERNRVLETERHLAFFRRYGDRRFYKGTEFADFIEVLAQKRAADIFANERVPAEKIFVNVQPLSGAAANNAVYEAFVKPGDAVMGLALSHGGHLSHGSPFNRSGKYFKVYPYTVNLETGRLDYDEIARQAKECQPRMIIGGGSAYPWDIDWKKLREIVDEVAPRAILMADIAHTAGLVAGGVFPNPVGYADVVTMTTHKTLCGPRGAIILTTDKEKAKRINSAVFPGEQGGPHINNIAAMAVCFKLAKTEEFKNLQRRVVNNARTLSDSLKKLGFTILYGGTSTHLLLIDLNAIETESGVPLKGDAASNILDLCGITCNKNAIPGDETGLRPGGIRLGTVIPSQLGMGKVEMEKIAGLIHKVIMNIRTFRSRSTSTGTLYRGKISPEIVDDVRREVATMMAQFSGARGAVQERSSLEIRGERATAFLQQVCAGDIVGLKIGITLHTLLLNAEGGLIDDVAVKHVSNERGVDGYLMTTTPSRFQRVKAWLKDLSDGYVIFNTKELYGKIDGPVEIVDLPAGEGLKKEGSLSEKEAVNIDALLQKHPTMASLTKPYCIGQGKICSRKPAAGAAKKEFAFHPYEGKERRTALYGEHVKLTSPKFMIPFAGWSMPVWYTRASEEHAAVRTAAGLFDVSHMGRIDIRGAYAGRFLDLVTTNFISILRDGMAHYSYILDPDGNVMDDILVYRFTHDHYFLIVNAANAEKITAWLTSVNAKDVVIDRACPWREVEGTVTISDLRSPEAGERWNVNVALQGPKSTAILLRMMKDREQKRLLREMGKFHFIEVDLEGIPSIVASTGYTGEDVGYEILVPGKEAVRFWRTVLEKGSDLGVKPCGLASRDSLRIEAGLPLYGHELEGDFHVTPTIAGYGGFVKLHKTSFIGRSAYIEKHVAPDREIVRFKLVSRRARMVKNGDPVVSREGECVGYVTSSTLIDKIQSGMAAVALDYTAPGTKIGVFPLSKAGKGVEGALAKLKVGQKIVVHESALVLPRFPLRQQKKSNGKPTNR